MQCINLPRGGSTQTYTEDICLFLLNMAFISSSEVENIYISCENIKIALFISIFYCISLLCIPDRKDKLGPRW